MTLTKGLTGLLVLIPIAILTLFAFLGYGQYTRIETAKFQQKSINSDIQQVRMLMAALQEQPVLGKHIASRRSAQEQADFLESLRIHAADARVKIELFVAQAPIVMPANPDQSVDSLTSKYQPMLTTVAVVGPFEGTREFAYAIMHSDLLMNMSQIKWERSNTTGEVRLTCLITRYVTDDLPEDDEETEESTDTAGQMAENGNESTEENS